VISVNDAFAKFKSNLEIGDREEADAIRRREQVYECLCDNLQIADRFLTGSYRRETKTKPLKDVDLFILLKESERGFLSGPAKEILEVFGGVLGPKYGSGRVGFGHHSVRVDFGRRVDADVTDGIMSFDIVPAFTDPAGGYQIPNAVSDRWMRSDPRIHATQATAANAALGGKWKPLVKMLKKWNEHNGKPIKPSFLIEVMAMEMIHPPFNSYPYDLRQFLADAVAKITWIWPDPARLGPAVSERMNTDPAQTTQAVAALRAAESACTRAMVHERAGRTGEALNQWQLLFGPLFVKS